MKTNHHTAEVMNPSSQAPFLLTCEHANNKLPAHEPENLGMHREFIESYHGYDLGIPHVARKTAEKLNSTCVLGVYSRLYIDLNRHLEAPDILHDHDDEIIIPGNQNLSAEAFQKRLDEYYHPYHEICEHHVNRLMDLHKTPIIFSFHSFPRFQTSYEKPFPWNFTLHYNKDHRIADVFKEYLQNNHPDISIGDNEPYNLKQLNTGGAVIHGENRGLPALLIEIPNDQMNKDAETDFWSDVICNALKEAARIYNPDSFDISAAA